MGKLYICGTPIGNLEDVTIRLLKTLRCVDMIACEDTRRTIKLLNRYRIKKHLVSFHEHSRKSRENYILKKLQQGKHIALVSDAGMPLISDPGQELVRRAIEAGIEIEVIPGPSALISALVVSGLDSSSFLFEGFLSERKGKRRQSLMRLKNETKTVILYESPHRLIDLLADIEEIMGENREIVIVRELTKKHEEIKRDTVGRLRPYFQDKPLCGEITVLIAGREKKEEQVDLEIVAAEVEQLIEMGVDKKEAFRMKAREHNIKKSIIYDFFLQKNKNSDYRNI